MHAQPQEEHRWLEQLVGDWTFDGECMMGPDKPPVKTSGSETVYTLGGLWIVTDSRGAMPGGGEHRSMITLGYDPQLAAFVGTFVGSPMTHLWIYRGQLDAARRILTLDTEGPSFGGTGSARYQDIVEIVDADHRILRSQLQTDDGKWVPFMTAHYRRR